MTITPKELARLSAEKWKCLEEGRETLFVKPEGTAMMFRLTPLPANGGTLSSLLAALRSNDELDDDELESFAADVEAGRKVMNQIPVSRWDS